ncbi:MAG: LPS export ABC transporter permease LptG [Thermodesulfobacteriota bacterium]|jgi:lipopolysaccharide export system permease protein|nr:MAG: LPS export ABC transporter permease LptG [Thermodesulfobacteriota bacterium]
MTIITRYILREFIKVFLFSLAVIVVLYFIGNLADRLGDFLKYKPSFESLLQYFCFNNLATIFQVTPIPVLLATSITIGILSRNFEIIALRSSGVSLSRTISPILIAALCISIVTLFGNELVSPYATQKAKAIARSIKGKEKKKIFNPDQIWFRGKEIIYNIKYFSSRKNTLYGVTLYFLNHDFALYKRVDAEQAIWRGNTWVFQKVFTREFEANNVIKVSFTKETSFPLEETPETFKQEIREPEEMSYLELKGYIEKTTQEGYDATKSLADLYAKLSSPFINFFIALFGIPFALKIGKHGGFAVGITLSCVIGMAYWFFYGICNALGAEGALSPLISAWAANFVFGILGFYLLLHVKY